MVICSALMYNFETGSARWNPEVSMYIDPQTGGKNMFQVHVQTACPLSNVFRILWERALARGPLIVPNYR